MRLWTTLALVLACGAAAGAQLKVEITAHSDATDCLRDGALIAKSPKGKSSADVRIELGSNPHSLTVRDDGPWAVAASKNGCWTGESVWNPGDDTTLLLRVYKATAVEGEFSKTARAPSAVRGVVYPRSGPEEGLETTCSVSGSHWRCSVPSGHPFDLRLDPPGFASLHHWDLIATASEVKRLGESPLTPGASVAGWIVDPKDTPIRDARVMVFPLDALTSTAPPSAARLQRTRTNARGFFQIAGLKPAGYRLVSQVSRLSPLVVADIPVREAENVVLPKTLRHTPLGELEIVLEPAVDAIGQPWTVEMRQATTLYPGQKPLTVARPAGTDGRWTVRDVPDDLYSGSVRSTSGSLMTQRDIDVFDGKTTALVNVPNIVVRGVVKVGSEPLQTDLNLTSSAGQFVKTQTAGDGTFRVTLPAAGTWFPTILHPPGTSSARIRARPILIPEGPPPSGDSHEVIVQLPGGRIHGVVASRDGKRGRAAVHARREGRIEAQQIADDEGAFDLIGLTSGVYELDAQAATGGTRQPVRVEIDDDEDAEVRLTTEPFLRLSGAVLTPSGRPASGAMIQISQDGGVSWRTELANADGVFRHDLNASTKRVQLIVVTYDYPSAILSMPVPEELVEIRLRQDGGFLRFTDPRTVYVAANGVSAMAPLFYYPRPPGQYSGGVFLQSGDYVVCPGRVADDRCREVHVNSGSDQSVDFDASHPEGKP